MDSYVGKKFGNLVIIEDMGYYQKEGTKTKKHYVKCKCSCGNERITRLDALKSGKVVSCGCYAKVVCQSKGFDSKKYNDFYIQNKTVYVTLYNSNKKLICDIDSWNSLKQYCWSECNGYVRARNTDTGSNVLFHHMVMNNKYIDHINGNGLDNRKCNLRLANKSQNAMNQKIRVDNTSGYKGIRKLPSGKYSARIVINGVEKYLGTFDNINDAIKTREKAEIEYFSDFRRIA